MEKQVISLWAVGNGYLDKVPVDQVKRWEAEMHAYLDASHPEIGQSIARTNDLTNDTIESLRVALDDFNNSWTAE
jgi:F-type H+-transporting ATPase subunit alpha